MSERKRKNKTPLNIRRTVKTLFAVAVALVAAALCAFVMIMLYRVEYLPEWLKITVMALCGFSVIADYKLLKRYVMSLD